MWPISKTSVCSSSEPNVFKHEPPNQKRKMKIKTKLVSRIFLPFLGAFAIVGTTPTTVGKKLYLLEVKIIIK